MKRVYYSFVAVSRLACMVVADAVIAGDQNTDLLIFVADNREAGWSISKFWIDLYNTSPYMFGLWCTISVASMGVVLGFATDQLMKLTGLDLTSRDIVEH